MESNGMSKEDASLLELLANRNKQSTSCIDSDDEHQPGKPKKNKNEGVNITDESDDSDDITRQEKINEREKHNKTTGYTKPRYLIEKDIRNSTSPQKFAKKRDRKEYYKNDIKQHKKYKNASDDEANLPNLDDLGIKIEERNNQIMFDVSYFVFIIVFLQLNNKKKVEVKNFRGSVLIDLREYFYKENQWLPTKKGLSITKDIWDKFKAIIPHVDLAIKKISCEDGEY